MLSEGDEELLRPASAFCDRYHPVFKEMYGARGSDASVEGGEIECGSDVFPSAPFSDFKWLDFMRLAGMQCDVTTDMFVNFAAELANEALTGIGKA